MTNIWNTEFTNYVNYLKNEGMGSAYNKAFNHTTISVNLEGLRDNWAQFNAAKNALGLLSKFTGLSFTLTTSASADIRTDNEDASGAYAYTIPDDQGYIDYSYVNVSKSWPAGWSIGQYGVQTFIHEFGHALGLNHGGQYNGSGDYATHAKFKIDTWQYSIMSYFTQDNYDNASYLYLIGPMIGDIKALNDLYGRLSANAGNTLYGRGETAISGWTDFGRYSQATYCINDTSGIDTMDYSNTATNNNIDLRAGYFSDINGYRGNVSISLGTVIENAYGGSAADNITGNTAANLLMGFNGADSLFGNAGNDSLAGGAGNDILVGGAGADRLDGGADVDTIYYNDSTTGLQVSLLNASLGTGNALGDVFVGIENVYGSGYADTLSGNHSANTIWGAAGDDTLFGNAGNDVLYGGSGSDSLVGGIGADVMDGGTGTDTAFYNDATSGLVASLLDPASNTGIAAGDRYVSIENLYGSAYNDTLSGNNLANTIWGVSGNDTIFGHDGNDALNGGAGNDYIVGGNGVDAIVGGIGFDQLIGGANSDRFVFTTAGDSSPNSAGRDIIYDFSYADGDRIDLSIMDANTSLGGNQAFTFIGTAAFTGVAGQLHVETLGNHTLVLADLNGDRVADFGITVANVNALSSLNYIL